MEPQQNIPGNGVIQSKPKKKKPLSQVPENFQPPVESLIGSHDIRSKPSKKGNHSSKRRPMEDVSHAFQHEKSISGSLPESSTSETEYRALRRKYLLLEEESFALEKGLMEVEDNVKALEDEKLALLDDLVILEGLIDPSEIHPHGQGLH